METEISVPYELCLVHWFIRAKVGLEARPTGVERRVKPDPITGVPMPREQSRGIGLETPMNRGQACGYDWENYATCNQTTPSTTAIS